MIKSDLPNTPTKSSKKPNNRIEISLRAEYRPGRGLPLPATLLPDHDSTAYIHERILLPATGLAKDGKPLPKRMAYLIGWHDLPAATMLVPAMEILDYVSPLALEQWEYEAELELDETRRKLEAEKNDKEASAVATGPKKKRGRPPKHSQIESAVVDDSEDELAGTTSFIGGGALALSTPQKSRLVNFDEGLTEEEESNNTPTRQLLGEATWGSAMDVDEDMDGEEFDAMGFDTGRYVEGNDSPDTAEEEPTQQQNFSATVSLPSATHSVTQRSSSSKSPLKLQQTPVPIPSYAAQSQTKTSNTSKPPKPKTAKENPVPTAKEDAEWEIQRIEDVQTYDVEGRGLVRYFKVRWEGDWPEDQNPTWEPEENLTPQAVRNFLKTPKSRRVPGSSGAAGDTSKQNQRKAEENGPTPQKKKLKQTLLSWAAKRGRASDAARGSKESTEDHLANPEASLQNSYHPSEKFPEVEDDKDANFGTPSQDKESSDDMLLVPDD